MPEAADRIRVEPKSPPKRVRTPPPSRKWTRALRALAPKSRRGYAGAALFAMMIGIVVNALALQHGRHIDLQLDPPATAFVAPPSSPAASAPKASAAPAPGASSAAIAPPTPPVRAPTATATVARVQKSSDPITEFLRSNGSENKRLVGAAQLALARLGFSVKPTGAIDAETRSAMIEFEKSRRLPVSTEVTAKLVKTLTAAAAN